MPRSPKIIHRAADSPHGIWCSYHEAQIKAFRILFPGEPFGSWNRHQCLNEAQRKGPQLEATEKDEVLRNLQIAKRGRAWMLKEFPYDTEEATAGHQRAIGFLRQLSSYVRRDRVNEQRRAGNAPASPDLEHIDTDSDGQLNEHASGTSTPQSEEDSVREHVVAQETLDEDMLQTFIELVAASVESICGSWSRVSTENMEISCATAGEQESYPQAEISLKYGRFNMAVSDAFLHNCQYILHQPAPFHHTAQ